MHRLHGLVVYQNQIQSLEDQINILEAEKTLEDQNKRRKANFDRRQR